MEAPQLHNNALPLVQNKGMLLIHAFYLVDCHLHIKRRKTLSGNLYKLSQIRMRDQEVFFHFLIPFFSPDLFSKPTML